jgi:hypothetical protein
VAEENIFVTNIRIISLITALLMVAVGIFWMFMWLIGTNGFSQSKGGAILLSNLVMVLLAIIGSSLASGWLANELQTTLAWSLWVIAPLAIAAVIVATIVALFVGSLIVVGIVGT